jgi:hypothetical protein
LRPPVPVDSGHPLNRSEATLDFLFSRIIFCSSSWILIFSWTLLSD